MLGVLFCFLFVCFVMQKNTIDPQDILLISLARFIPLDKASQFQNMPTGASIETLEQRALRSAWRIRSKKGKTGLRKGLCLEF